jgi:adenylosuccinate lyase
MLTLWGPATRYGLWRRLWLALAESQQALGVDIPDDAIAAMRAHLDDIDFAAVAAYERRFRHDVMAHVHAFGDAAPAARKFIHLGATSCYVTDNAELILMRRGLSLLREKLLDALAALDAFARTWKDLPALGYTHLQPAQLTTVGKRATLWMQDILLDLEDLETRIARLPFRGVKGTTGTQASFLTLFGGDHQRVRELDRMVTTRMGFTASIPVSGQTYSRKIDAQVLAVVSGIAATRRSSRVISACCRRSVKSRNRSRRNRSARRRWPTSATPCVRSASTSLARFVLSLEPNANQTHAVQYFERTLDDSANRRLVIPESFLATDALLVLLQNVVRGLEVHPARIRRRVEDEFPFMATEELIVRFVQRGAIGRSRMN